MRILSIDSTASSASAAILEDGKIISDFFLNVGLKHSTTLLSLVDNVLNSASLTIKDIDFVSVNVGPGSFTGVRIGVSLVKGLCFTNNIKCIPVSTLESMAYNFQSFDCYVVSAMDARCNQVYTAFFEVNQGKIRRLTDDDAMLISDIRFIPDKTDKPIYLVGDGAKLCSQSLDCKQIRLAGENLLYQNAVSTALYAFENLDKAIDSDEILPFYLRPSQAERNLKSKEK